MFPFSKRGGGISLDAGVKRQIAVSIGFELAQYPDALSDLIRDEQIKVMGCQFANLRVRHC